MVNQTLSKYVVRQEDVNTTNFNTCELTFYRQFNMVVCYYHFWTKEWNNTNDYTALAANIIPEAFRPNDVFYQTVVNYSGSVKHGLLSIFSDGSVTYRLGNAGSDMSCYGSVTYFVED